MIFISIFAFIYMNCTGKMVRVGSWKVGNLTMVKLKKKSLRRGSFRTHGRVIGNKNFFIFGLNYHQIRTLFLLLGETGGNS